MDIEADILLVLADAREARKTIDLLWGFEAGTRTYWCRDGIEALEFVFGTGRHWDRPVGHPKLVLLDAGEPLLGGAEVLRRIRSSAASDDVTVAVLDRGSGEDEPHQGQDTTLPMPLTSAGLERTLRRAGLGVDRLEVVH